MKVTFHMHAHMCTHASINMCTHTQTHTYREYMGRAPRLCADTMLVNVLESRLGGTQLVESLSYIHKNPGF